MKTRKILIFIFLLLFFNLFFCLSTTQKPKLDGLSRHRIEMLSHLIQLIVDLNQPNIQPKIDPIDIIQNFKPIPVNDPDSVKKLEEFWSIIEYWIDGNYPELIKGLNNLTYKNDTIYRFLFQAYIGTKNFRSAVEIGRQISNIDSTITLLMGVCYYKNQEFDTAISCFDSLYKCSTYQKLANEYLGDSYFTKGIINKSKHDTVNMKINFNHAAEHYKKVLVDKNAPSYIRYFLGTTYYYLKDYDNAIYNFTKCYEKEDLRLESLIGMILAYKDNDKLEEFQKRIITIENAMNKYEDICPYVQLMVSYYYLLGEDYWERNDSKKANESWKEANRKMTLYFECVEESIPLMYMKAMISLIENIIENNNRGERLARSLDQEHNLKQLFELAKTNKDPKIDTDLFCKYIGNIAFLFDEEKWALEFFKNVKKLDDITYANILALDPSFVNEMLDNTITKTETQYKFFIELNKEFASLKIKGYLYNENRLAQLNVLKNFVVEDLANQANSIFSKYLSEYNKRIGKFYRNKIDSLEAEKDRNNANISKIDSLIEHYSERWEDENKQIDKYRPPMSNYSSILKYLPIKENRGIKDIIIIPTY